jgi:hypothetical protein
LASGPSDGTFDGIGTVTRQIMPSDRSVRNAKGKTKPYKLADGGGLYLLVKPDGARYWRMDFRFSGRRGTLPLAFILLSV